MSASIHVIRFLATLATLTTLTAIAAPDYAREARWAGEIAPTVVVGDAIYLAQPAGHKFLALYTEARNARAAVIVVHGLGVHPDWALIGALRSSLPDFGYTTLSIQMPVLAADALREEYPALFPDAAERLAAAVAFLKSKGHLKIALASHSLGANMSNHFLTAAPTHGIAAWIAIGIFPAGFTDTGQLKLPILDIYGERDFPQVLQNADARATVLSRLKGSAQIEVPGADHYFSGHDGALAMRVRQFLEQRIR